MPRDRKRWLRAMSEWKRKNRAEQSTYERERRQIAGRNKVFGVGFSLRWADVVRRLLR